MKKALLLAVLLVLIPAVYAQLPWAVTDLRCGNDKLDEFELCEKGIESPNYCDDVAELLGIDTVCDVYHCTCLPRVNKAYCGNDRREGVEICDGSGEDFCGNLSQILNMSLVCDPSTCGCELNETVPKDYNPLVIEELENASQTASVCGDKKVERAEDCDPPNTLCTTDGGEPGICTKKCRCVEPAALDDDNEPVKKDEAPVPTLYDSSENVSDDSNVTEQLDSAVDESDTDADAVPESEPEVEERGFFGRLWAWIVGIFS